MRNAPDQIDRHTTAKEKETASIDDNLFLCMYYYYILCSLETSIPYSVLLNFRGPKTLMDDSAVHKACRTAFL